MRWWSCRAVIRIWKAQSEVSLVRRPQPALSVCHALPTSSPASLLIDTLFPQIASLYTCILFSISRLPPIVSFLSTLNCRLDCDPGLNQRVLEQEEASCWLSVCNSYFSLHGFSLEALLDPRPAYPLTTISAPPYWSSQSIRNGRQRRGRPSRHGQQRQSSYASSDRAI